MQALTFSEKEGLRLQSDYLKPDAAEGEALIKVIRAGICSTVRKFLSNSTPLAPLTTLSQHKSFQEAYAPPCAHRRHIARGLDLTKVGAGS